MTTYVSYSLPLGQGASASGGAELEYDITVGTLATNTTGVVELRVDTSTVTNMTRKDIDMIVLAFQRRLRGALLGASDFGMV